ncbi:MAG: hypothetical protein ACLU8F_00735 [Clostridia bacterium]
MNKRYQIDRIFLSKKYFKRRCKKVLKREDVSSLTSAIKDFTDILKKELFSEIVTQIENLVFHGCCKTLENSV